MSIRKHASIATLAVAGSRFAGLIREMVFAFFFGAGPALDAFIAAFRIPNLLRDLFAEGALSTAFVTVFSRKASQEGDEKAWALARIVMTFIMLFIGSLVVLGIIFSPAIVHVVASGFEGEKFQYTVLLNRILFPFILFVSLAALTMGMLNAKGKFGLPQSASTFFNITSIIAGLLLAAFFSPELMKKSFFYLMGSGERPVPTWDGVTRALTGMALGSLLGGIVQWFVQMPALWRLGYQWRPSFNFKDPAFLQVMKLTIPAIIGGAAVQVNVLVNTNFASYLADGSISWLNFAFRLMQFPIGVFGVSVAVATTPAVARLAATQDMEGVRKTLREGSQLALFLCIPSALGLIALAEPIMSLIYEYGRFTAFDTQQAAFALQAYAVGLCFYALIKIYQPVFLAFNDARTPMVISMISIIINLGLNWLLAFQFHFQHWGLALGTSGVAIWNAVMLSICLRRKTGSVWTGEIWKQSGKILLASALSVLAGWVVYREMFFILGTGAVWKKGLLVFPPILMTVMTYAFFCSRLGVQEVRWIQDKFFKKFKRA